MKKALTWPVLIAALGYFVDMFDLTIFGVVRLPSLRALGIVDPIELTNAGVLLMNLQAAGMLVGGLLWGILGDKRGRLSVLFGSIILYSLANLLNAAAVSLNQYAVLRFLAGVGLAGELGAAVTLVTESLTPELRGYGTTIIAALGLLGAVAAALIGQLMPWNVAYFFGGILGLLLLTARFKMVDSAMFKNAGSTKGRGNLRLLFTHGRFMKYLQCILAGVPIYFVTGILFTFAPEISVGMGLKNVTAGNALLAGSIGLTCGDLLSGLVSQWIKSRKHAIQLSMLFGAFFGILYFSFGSLSSEVFYAICFGLGLCGGYWAVLVTIAAEQFGTNIRATVATSVPNFVRSSVILMTLGFSYLKSSVGVLNAATMIGSFVLLVGVLAVSLLPETYGKDLDYVETIDVLEAAETAKAMPF